jgi:KRAB domain-containing zinc finger protein
MYKCDICFNTYSNQGNLYSHKERVHQKVNRFFCDHCDYKSYGKACLASHVHNLHTTIIDWHVCNTCGFKAKTSDSLNRHTNNIHMTAEYVNCDICNQQVKKKSISQHIQGVHSDKTYRCDVCDFTTKNKVSLFNHKKWIHASDPSAKDFVCPLCPKMYSREAVLKDHIRKSHEKLKKTHQCIDCDKFFHTDGLLKNHTISVHLGLTKSTCETCQKVFSTPNNLRRHQKETHLKMSKIICEICQAELKTEDCLKSHMKAIHGEMAKVKCTVCHFFQKNCQFFRVNVNLITNI